MQSNIPSLSSDIHDADSCNCQSKLDMSLIGCVCTDVQFYSQILARDHSSSTIARMRFGIRLTLPHPLPACCPLQSKVLPIEIAEPNAGPNRQARHCTPAIPPQSRRVLPAALFGNRPAFCLLWNEGGSRKREQHAAPIRSSEADCLPQWIPNEIDSRIHGDGQRYIYYVPIVFRVATCKSCYLVFIGRKYF